MARKPVLFAAAVVVAAGAVLLVPRFFGLVWVAQAQVSSPAFVARTRVYTQYGTPNQKFSEERSFTMTLDGITWEAYSLPGRPLSEFAFTQSYPNGHRVIGVGPIGLKTRAPVLDAEAMARARAYRSRLREAGCVDAGHGEIFLTEERLLGKWLAVVVLRRPIQIGQNGEARSTFWRIKELDCFTAQAETDSVEDGQSVGKSFSQLVSLEPTTVTAETLAAQLSGLKEVAPAELLSAYLKHIGQRN